MSSLIDSSSQKQHVITAAQMGAKFKSKKEIYFFLTIDAKAYLPHHTTVTIYVSILSSILTFQ